jgi:hypothetical protein
MTQHLQVQLVTNKPIKSIVHEAHDFGGERVHVMRTPAPDDPLPKFRCDRCNRTLPGDQFASVAHSGKLARISHRIECIEATNQRKLLCHNHLSMIRGAPRCRQTVPRISSNLNPSKGGR